MDGMIKCVALAGKCPLRITEMRRTPLCFANYYCAIMLYIHVRVKHELVHAEQREIGKPTIPRHCKYHNYKLHIYFVSSLSNNERAEIITTMYQPHDSDERA